MAGSGDDVRVVIVPESHSAMGQLARRSADIRSPHRHMRPAAFEFERAISLAEAAVCLAEGDGPDLVVMCTPQ